jgi:phosphoribosyl-ATP pyrophosphohydrolase
MDDFDVLAELWDTIQDRKANPSPGSYTCRLFEKGDDEVVKKLGEEAIEVIVAAKGQGKEAIVREAADLTYHLWVLLAQFGVSPADVFAELRRRRASGK